jgi:two-component system, cell cycle sensor histidine kinase and response regulator CckA
VRGVEPLEGVGDVDVALLRRELAEAREHARRLRATMESALDAWLLLTSSRDDAGTLTDLVVQDANHRAGDLFRRPSASLLGASITTLVPGASRWFPRLERLLATGEAIEGETEVTITGDQTPRLRYAVVRIDPDDVVVRVRDITEQHRATAALRASEERFRAAIEGNFDGFAVLEPRRGPDGTIDDFVVTSTTERLARMVRRPLDALVGHSLREIEPELATRGVIDQYRRVAASGTPARFELELAATAVMPTGWYEEHVMPLGDGLAITVRDISERKAVELALEHHAAEAAATAARLRALIAAAPLAVVEYAVDGTVLQWNPAADAMFGYLPDDVLGHDFHSLPCGGRVAEVVAELLATDPSASVELEVIHADGTPLLVSFAAGVVHGEGGEVVSTIVFAADVSDRERLEERLRHAQKMEAVGRLAGGLAHDFNNLLTTILGNCELMSEELDHDSPLWTGLDDILHASQRAARLADQMLTIGRRQVRAPTAVDLDAVVATMRSMVRRAIPEDIEIEVHPHGATPAVVADPAQLEQVLLNLVLNARDAMPMGGRLVIATGVPDAAELQRKGLDAGVGWARLTVSDTGHGMDAATLEQIFEPFFTTKERGKGSGLGLSTVHGIISQSGGHITASSRPGEGTRFDVYLPATMAAAEAATPSRSTTPMGTTAGTILLVEDDPSVRSLALRSLERAGHRVLVAEDGTRAMAVAASHADHIDVLVTDVVMPGIGGPEVARRLVAIRPTLRVLFVSGYAEDVVGPTDLLGYGDILAKPFRPSDLVARVAALLGTPAP